MSSPPPRVIRFESAVTSGASFGLVVDDADGVPTRAINLTALHPELGGSFSTFGTDGFRLAKEVDPDAPSEEVTPERILSPVDITAGQLEAQERFVLSIGLNFEAHRAETKKVMDLMMVKPVEPTGPYQDHVMSPQAELLDHEAELACVLLEDLDLEDVPPIAELERRLAYMTVNDLTDRAPIILDDVNGYTKAKSDPGLLPLGPWMIAGTDLPIFTEHLGVAVTCAVSQQGGPMRERQRDVTSNLIRNPEAIFRLLAKQLRDNPQKCGHDREERAHHYAREKAGTPGFMVPAGSLLLTGTPGGTCIKAPKPLHRIKLLAQGGFTMSGARRRYVRECVERTAEIGYLQPGDVVETEVEHLGRQRWEVLAPR